MPKLKINWSISPKNESLIYDFDELELTQEEWDALTDEEKSEFCDSIVYDCEETVSYGLFDDFEII